MKILRLFLLGYIILITGCSKSTKDNNNIVTLAVGTYQTSSTIMLTQPVMYVYGAPVTDENIIKNYLSRKNLLDSFVFDKNEKQFSSVIKINLQTPIEFKYEIHGQLLNDTSDLPDFIDVNGSKSKLKLAQVETPLYPSNDLNSPLRTVINFFNANDSIQVKDIPQGTCYHDIGLFCGVPNYIVFDSNTGVPDTLEVNPNAYAFKSFPVIYQNDSLLFPLMTWTVSSQNGSCNLSSNNEWNFFILNTLPASSQSSDTVVIQQGYLQLNKQPQLK